jgi:recombination protein RecA
LPIDSKKLEVINNAVAAIEKNYGKGSIMQMGSAALPKIEAIPTGCFSLDDILGIGGIPRGRVTEIYGPESSGKTTLCLHIIAEAQKLNGAAAFIDAEHALDLNYASRLGVNVPELFLSQPDCGEQALEIADTLVSSNGLDIVVIDSVAALVPRSEIEGEMGDASMAVQARLMSQALRKLTGVISKSKTCVIFINQLRSKIGVMFGCFEANSKVTLANGAKEKIGKLVDFPKLHNPEIFCYDIDRKLVLPSYVSELHNNGKKESFWNLAFESISGSGKQGFNCTPEHEIITPNGDIKAKNVKVGDLAFHRIERNISKKQYELLYGSLLGDGHISKSHRYTANYREEHCLQQSEYLKWKLLLLSNLFNQEDLDFTQNKYKTCVSITSKSSYEFYELHSKFYEKLNEKFVKILPNNLNEYITPFALAILYMDDGTLDKRIDNTCKIPVFYTPTIYTSSFSVGENERLIKLINDTYNLGFTYYPKYGGKIQTFKIGAKKFFELIAPYVPESMQYKLPEEYKGKYNHDKVIENMFINSYYDIAPVKCLISKPTRQSLKTKTGYDLSVDLAQNYFVSDILVHNSPETTSGGNALKFYASLRLDIRRTAAIKQGNDVIGNRTKVKVVKSKVCPPFKEVEFDILYNQGIDKYGDLVDIAVRLEVIKKAGSWYTYDTDRFQGREKFREIIQRDPIFFNEIRSNVVQKLQSGEVLVANNNI